MSSTRFQPTPLQDPFATNTKLSLSSVWQNWFAAVTNLFNLLFQTPNVFSGQAQTVSPGSNNLVNTVNAPGSLTVTMTLPAATAQALPIRFIKTSPDANTVTIAVANAGTEKINNATTKVLAAQFQACTLVPDGGSIWYVF